MTTVIDPDNESTWPAGLIPLFQAHAPAVTAFEDVERGLDQLSLSQRISKGHDTNPYQDIRDTLLADAETIIKDCWLIGYHATRLTTTEKKDVATNGLQVLSPELIMRRVHQACEDGVLQAADADVLARTSLSAVSHERQGKRLGLLWMIFSKELCRDNGLYRLLQFWSGEATYWAHEDTELGSRLRKIGTPTIAVCETPVRSLEIFGTVSARLLAAFMQRRGVRCENGYGFEGFTTETTRVTALVQFGTDKFDSMTCHDQWPVQLT